MENRVLIRAIGKNRTRVSRISTETHEKLLSRAIGLIIDRDQCGFDVEIKREVDLMADGPQCYMINMKPKAGPFPEISLEPEIQYP